MVGRVNDRDKLAAALAGKGGKYKPEEPFVLAVLLMSDGTVDHEDIEAALLGPIAYPIDADKPISAPKVAVAAMGAVMTAFAIAKRLAGVNYWSYDRDTDCPPGSASPICNSLGGVGAHGFLRRFLAAGLH